MNFVVLSFCFAKLNLIYQLQNVRTKKSLRLQIIFSFISVEVINFGKINLEGIFDAIF